MAWGLKYVSKPPFPTRRHEEPSLILVDPPFKPDRVGTSREQIEMAEDRRPSVLVIQELVHEEMDRCPKRIKRKVSHILRKYEQCECSAER